MRKFTVLTTMNHAIHEATGRRMLTSLMRWPSQVGVTVAFEGTDEEFSDFEGVYGERIRCIDFRAQDAALDEWMAQYRHYPGQDSLRKCAWRFAYKSFAVTGVGMDLGADVLIWLDADTYTHRELPIEQLEDWMPRGKLLTYLGRGNAITECGLVMYDLRHSAVRGMLADWRNLYTTGKLFGLPEWNDCAAFDWARLKWTGERQWNNLTPWAQGYVHAFINGPTGAYMDHMKGPRKGGGRSLEKDVISGRCSAEFLAYLRSSRERAS